jgi:acetyltransferase-like isoleucine patch superfamily enzyme
MRYQFGSIGKDVVISESVVFKHPRKTEIGSHVAIDDFCFFSTTVQIKDYVHIGPHVSVIGGLGGTLILNEFSSIAAGARIVVRGDCLQGDGLSGPVPKEFKDGIIGDTIEFGKFSAVGTNSVVLPNSQIAEGSVISAGSVFGGASEPWTVYFGNPARPIKERNSSKMLIKYEKLQELKLKLENQDKR